MNAGSPPDIARAAHIQVPDALADLARLVAIPSVSADPAHLSDVDASAAEVAALFRGLGWDDVSLLNAGGGTAVVARRPAPPGAPTVCLYAHHDVQPPGDASLWASDPFTVAQRDRRLYGRGVVDDKAGILVHLTALRAWGGCPPVGVTVFVEGEEEVGSPSLARFLDAHRDLLAADVFVLCDSANWAVGHPAFTTTLRGLCDVVVEVATLDHALHSGQFGGAVPDALTALARLLATLHADDGEVAVEGLLSGHAADLDYPETQLRQETGVLDGVHLLGRDTIADRLWAKPSVTVLAIDSTRVDQASNTLTPTARAKVSARLAPGQDAEAALAALKAHLLAHAPWGARVTFHEEGAADGSVVPFEGPYADAAFAAFAEAWGVDPVFVGQGGSIPLVGDLRARFPEATILVTGVGDPDSRMHGIDESLDLRDFARACVAEALLLGRLGESGQVGGRSA